MGNSSLVRCIYKSKKTSNDISIPFPSLTSDGIYENTHAPWAWVVGFWPGLLWLLYEKEHYDPFKNIAISREDIMDGALDEYVNIHHDVGFMWQLTSVKQWELLGTEKGVVDQIILKNNDAIYDYPLVSDGHT
ncbi:hypothetical protein QWY96_18085 [Vibrio artabrorum]|uniref:Uncharacterized protein n=1 Tax=Vibrio artabrorum TaxID=446374 RepID=A0ABT8CP84_9VIBR|nr:hypothetical protein [Vibrio artabrorum]MDN3702343.1 hypothetical protein [Vibrio artabrorum]